MNTHCSPSMTSRLMSVMMLPAFLAGTILTSSDPALALPAGRGLICNRSASLHCGGLDFRVDGKKHTYAGVLDIGLRVNSSLADRLDRILGIQFLWGSVYVNLFPCPAVPGSCGQNAVDLVVLSGEAGLRYRLLGHRSIALHSGALGKLLHVWEGDPLARWSHYRGSPEWSWGLGYELFLGPDWILPSRRIGIGLQCFYGQCMMTGGVGSPSESNQSFIGARGCLRTCF